MKFFDYISSFATRSVIFAGLLLLSGATVGAELLMIESDGCPYCAKFDHEIAPAYPKTVEGKTAPLRRLQLSDPWPSDLQEVRQATVTPTFILVEDGIEIDRLVGYPGDDHFWFLLNEMLEKR